jgi:hypothetical protein
MALAKAATTPVPTPSSPALDDHTRLFGQATTSPRRWTTAQLRSMQSRYEDAVAIGRELIEARTKSLGPANIATISAINTVATTLIEMNQFDESERLMQRATADWEKAQGPDHPLTLELRSNTAWLYYWWAMTLDESDPAREEKLTKARTMGEAVVAIAPESSATSTPRR